MPTSNRLADATSPYLRQHAGNPVHWQPWGEEALALARRLDRPLFVSIGYSTCHWCHVMAHESFADPGVAELMNRAFVNVKVDREERPDVDALYMAACHLLTGSGGWPLNVVLTPDGEPFFAATYVPRESRMGRLGMLELVPRLEQVWRTQKAEAAQAGQRLLEHLAGLERDAAGAAFGPDAADRAQALLASRFDAERGGFGAAPKFPSPHQLVFLLRHARRTGNAHSLRMAEKSLTAMRLGGIWDHVGHGFHRYSTDARWLLPHFEKMLYDQAMQLWAYTEGYAATGDPLFARTARETAAYVLRDLGAGGDGCGAFAAAEDADSEGAEGRFYIWTRDELDAALDRDAEWAAEVLNARPEGNFLDEAAHRLTGANVLHLAAPPPELAARRGMDREEFEQRLESARARLLLFRARRPRPGLDDKVLAGWNGLMIGALSLAARCVQPELAVAAVRAADFLLARLRMPDGRLLRSWRDGRATVPAMLEDYACLAWGLGQLFETVGEVRYLRTAAALAQVMDEEFLDEATGGYFLAPAGGRELPLRQKELLDGAMPAASSMAMFALARLARLTGRTDWEDRVRALAACAAAAAPGRPDAACAALTALALVDAGPDTGRANPDVVIVGRRGDAATEDLLAAYGRACAPDATLVFKDISDPVACAAVEELCPHARGRELWDGRAAAYVCRAGRHCEEPLVSPAALEALLRGPDRATPADQGA